MRKAMFLAFCFVFLVTFNVSAASIVMEGDYVKTAISANGTLGYGSGTSPGLIHDPAGTGDFSGHDYLTPGSPWELFSVNSAQTGLQTNNNTNPTGGPMTLTSMTSGVAYDNDVTWTGSFGTFFDITNHYFFNNGDERVNIVTTIKALQDLNSLKFLRSIDPDPDNYPGGTASTTNGRGYGSIAPEDWVHSEGGISGLTLGLFSDSDITHNTGVSSGWSDDPDFYLAGTNNGDGDNTIGIAFEIGDLLSGNSAALAYSYVMGGSLGTSDIPGVNPVPEPATMVLFALGLLGLTGVSRRKK